MDSALNRGGQVDVVYTDFSKAFDKVPHTELLKVLNYFGFSDHAIKFFSSYLYNRKQFVSYLGFLSDEFLTQSGVPQGSNLGPLLFIMFINDIVDIVLNSKVLLYADDMKVFREIETIDDCRMLQEDLDRLVTWSQTRLKFNAGKCAVVRFTRKTRNFVHFQYSLNNTTLSVHSKFKDLGVIFDEKFSFSDHIIEISESAYKTLGFLCRSSSFFKNISTFKLLYFSLVRSRLEFGFLIWYPFHYYLIETIEQVQKKFLRFLYFKEFGIYMFLIPFSELLAIFELESLCKRHRVGSLVFLFKLINGIIDCSEMLARLSFLVPRPASRVRMLFRPHFAHSVWGNNSPINIIMRNYNSLGDNVDPM